MSFFTGYYIGKQISKSIKEEQRRQQLYQDAREWNENYEKEKAREERIRHQQEEKRRNRIKISSTKRAKNAYSELRDEIKKEMNYDEDGFVQAYVNWQLEVSTTSDRDIEPIEAIWQYKESLGWFTHELQKNDIKNAVIIEYDNLKPSLKQQIPKDLFIEKYVDWLDITLDTDPTGKYKYGLTSEGDTIEVLERVKEEMNRNPYIDYEMENNYENNNETIELDELERWFSLYEKGAISLEEYQTVKNDILRNNKDNNKEVEEKKENLIYSICSTCGTKYESVLESPSKCFFCGGEISNNLKIAINNEIDFNRMNLSKDIKEEDVEYILNQWEKIKHVISSDDFINKFNHIKEEYKDASFFDDKDFMDMIVNDLIRIINDE